MKLLKALIITLMSLLLTGCYTQLQYSQTMKKVTDKKQTNDTPVYSWSGEEKAESSQDKTNEDVAKAENKQEEPRDYIPVFYKDYEYATKYGNVYNFYGNDWDGHRTYPYSRYNSFYSWHPFSYDRWTYHSLYGRWYDRPHYGISVTFSWGWPSYHYGYYDPFYRPYYDYYWHQYYSGYAYGYGNFYGKSGYGNGYYPDKKAIEDNNVRYGPRSIGTNRVETDGNRSRTVERNRSAAVTNRTSSTVRTRSVGTTRTRDNTDRSSVNRDKSRDNSSSSRSRTRGQSQIDNSRVDRYNSRSSSEELPLVIDEKQLEQIRDRISNDRKSIINRSRLNSNRDDRTTFFNRMKNFFEQNTSSFSNGNNGRTLRTRSSFPSINRSAINRNTSSNNRSSVTRSKSSSSNSRSRGSGSSSSRSRSDSGSSSSSERSRGN